MQRRRRAHDLELLVYRRMVDDDVEHEAIELRFGQRIRAFELDRVLRREHVERLLELIGAPLNRDAVLLHRLEQRRLRLRRRAVDFVGEDDVGEDRARARTPSAGGPVAGSSWMRSVPVMSDGIRSGVNWMRENFRSSDARQRVDQQRLGQPRHADDQAVAADEQRQQHLVAPRRPGRRSALRSSAMMWSRPRLHPIGQRDVVRRIEVDACRSQSDQDEPPCRVDVLQGRAAASVRQPIDHVVDAELVGLVVRSTGAKPVSENSQYSLMSPLTLAIAISRLVGSLFSKMPQ